MRRLALACSLAALVAAPAAGAARLASVQPEHDGPLASIVTVSPPPSVAREHPMRWARWTAAPRTLSAASLAAFHGEAIVGLARVHDLAAVARDYGIHDLQRLPGLRAVDALVGDATLRALLTRGRLDARIRYVEPNGTMQPQHARNDPLTTQIDLDLGIPYEWQFGQTHVDLALNLSHGSPSILVGDVDTGIADIPDLAGKIAERWYAAPLTDASDPLGHGTAVASLIAANVDDGFGIAGFGGDSRVIMYRTNFENASVATAITTLVSRGVRIINLSLGADQEASVITDAVNAATSAGVLVVAAAGNDAKPLVAYPAAALQPAGGGQSYGLSVGASNYAGTLSFFSNFGPNLSLVAPGSYTNARGCSGVFAAIPTPAASFDTSCYAEYQGEGGARYADVPGTSFSSPEVAGVAALIWAARPDLKNYEVASILKDSATRPAGAAWTPGLGWGILDAAKALEEATGKSSADRVVVTPDSAAPVDAGGRFTETAKVAWADGSAIAAASVSCSASSGATPLSPLAQAFAKGVATCTFDVPATLGGQTVAGTIGVTESQTGLTASSPFKAKVVDATPPTVQALASSGRWGRPVELRFTASEESGWVSVHVVVYRGAAAVFRTTTGQQPLPVHPLAWPAPKARDQRPYRFCVTAKDRAGNTSAVSCAPIALG